MGEAEKIAFGETLPMHIIAVEQVGPGRFRTIIMDDEGDQSVLYLDVRLPLGDVEVRISHLAGGRNSPPTT